MKLRVGLIGLGSAWESWHRPALRTLADRFDVRAVCAPVARTALLAAEEFDAAAIDGFQALTRREDVDAVMLLSAAWYGALPILAACDAKKGVYCADAVELEKWDVDAVCHRVDEAGIAFFAELPCRLSAATLRLKELIATRLGTPQLVFCHRRQPRDTTGTFDNRAALRNLIEVVDWCRYVMGLEPSSVTGVVHRSHSTGKTDYRMISLDFSGQEEPGTGPLAQLSVGRYVPENCQEAVSFRPPADMQVICEHGAAFIDLPEGLTWFDEAGQHRENLQGERPAREQLLLGFHRAVTSLVRDTASLRDAHRALQIVAAAERSCRDGGRVFLEDLAY